MNIRSLILILLLLTLGSGCGKEEVVRNKSFADLEPTDVLVSVNGRDFTLSDLQDKVSFETAIFQKRNRLSNDDNRLIGYRKARERASIADYVIKEALVDEAKRLDVEPTDAELERDCAFLRKLYSLPRSVRGNEFYKLVGEKTGVRASFVERLVWVNALSRTLSSSDVVLSHVKEIGEKEIDEAEQRLKNFNSSSVVSNRLALAKLDKALKEIRAGRDFAEIGAKTDELNARHVEDWGSFTYQDLKEIPTEGALLADWAFRRGAVGDVSDKIYQLDDGASVVKILSKENGMLEESEAAMAVASVRLARMTVLMRDEVEVPGRDEIRRMLQEEVLRKAKSGFNKLAVSKCRIEYPCGTNLWPTAISVNNHK